MNSSIYIFIFAILGVIVVNFFFLIVSFYSYIKMLRLAKKYNPGYIMPYGKIKTWKRSFSRLKIEYAILFRTPVEFTNEALVTSLRSYRLAGFLSIACSCIGIILVSVLNNSF